MGYVLQMLRDPLRGLEAVRRVCRGHLILLETVSRPLDLLPAPLARLDARRDGSEWFVFNRRGLRKALDLAGWVVEECHTAASRPAGAGSRPARAHAPASRHARLRHPRPQRRDPGTTARLARR